jgi:hypothetical protein
LLQELTFLVDPDPAGHHVPVPPLILDDYPLDIVAKGLTQDSERDMLGMATSRTIRNGLKCIDPHSTASTPFVSIGFYICNFAVDGLVTLKTILLENSDSWCPLSDRSGGMNILHQ